MADLSDVLNVLATTIGAALYPNGTAQPSVAGVPVRVFAGWPAASSLDQDLASGTTNVSIFPTAVERNTSRYRQTESHTTIDNPETFTATVSGRTVTIGGAQPAAFYPQNLFILVGTAAYGYQTIANDTPSTIAAALAAKIAGASVVGNAVTVPAGGLVTARVGATATTISEIRRQMRLIQITIWSDTPAHRDAVAQPIDLALAQIQFLTMPDQTAARLIYRDSPMTDMLEKAKLYRRDLRYDVEYATTLIQTTADVLVVQDTTFNYDTGVQVSIANY